MIGKSGVYIEGTQVNGVKNRIAMQIIFNKESRVNTTPFLQELIEIMVGINVAQRNTSHIRAFTDCKSALAKVKDAITQGSFSAIHLPYGPLINAIKNKNPKHYKIEWIELHPEQKKKHAIWDENDYGIYNADTIASKTMYETRKALPTTTIVQANITDMLDAMIPTGAWLWKTNEGCTRNINTRIPPNTIITMYTHSIPEET